MVKKMVKPKAVKQPMVKGMVTGIMHGLQAHEDMHILKKAEEIKSSPERHKAAVHHAKSEVSHLQKVARKKLV